VQEPLGSCLFTWATMAKKTRIRLIKNLRLFMLPFVSSKI
jgi:hypothetical protein